MSTRSYIAKQIGENQYKTIYCHSDGYLTHNGAMLFDHYSNADKLDELLNLGDISYLAPNIYPDPSKPHSFKYDERQDGVIVAYGRDRGDKDIFFSKISLAQGKAFVVLLCREEMKLELPSTTIHMKKKVMFKRKDIVYEETRRGRRNDESE